MSARILRFVALATFAAALPVSAQQKVSLPARDKPVTLEARTLFQVGEVDGEDYENFANVTDVAFDSRGHLFVLDATAYRVIHFDAAGKYVRTIGRQGGGPGEFGFPTALAILPSGELVVNDAVRASLQVFNAKTGEFVRTAAVAEDLGRAVGRMRLAPTGAIITETMPSIQRGDGRRMGDSFQMPPRSVSMLTLGSDGVIGRRLYNTPPRDMKMSATGQGEGGSVRFSMSVSAFEPSLLWAPTADGGVAVSSTEFYRIVLSDNQGRPVRYLERDIQPKPVTDADKKRWLENRSRATAGGSGTMIVMGSRVGGDGRAPAPAPVQRITGADIKEADVNWGNVIPVLTSLASDSWGRIWAQRADGALQAGLIDLIDRNGQYLGTLTGQQMPRAFGPDGRAAWIERDDLDVQRVVVKQFAR